LKAIHNSKVKLEQVCRIGKKVSTNLIWLGYNPSLLSPPEFIAQPKERIKRFTKK